MTCAPADRLTQSLKVHAPGVTDAVLQLELFNVMDEFLRRTMTWQWQTEIDLREGDTEYSLDVPVNAVVVRMIGVSHNGVAVQSTAQAGVTQSSLGEMNPELTFPDGDSMYAPAVIDLQPNNQFTYAIYRPEYITTTFTPDAEQVKYPLLAAYALSVGRSCLECDCGDWDVPEWMWDMYFHDWYDGVLGRLYGMPAKPWANPTQAVYHAKRFRNQMAFRKQESLRSFVYGVGGWRFPHWTR